jgi:hypothetical protein
MYSDGGELGLELRVVSTKHARAVRCLKSEERRYAVLMLQEPIRFGTQRSSPRLLVGRDLLPEDEQTLLATQLEQP